MPIIIILLIVVYIPLGVIFQLENPEKKRHYRGSRRGSRR